MNWRDIQTLYVRELRSALRERGIIVNAILIPIVLYPLILWLMFTGITFVSGQEASQISRIALMHVPEVHAAIKKTFSDDSSIQIVDPADPQLGVRNGEVDAIVDFLPASNEAGAIPNNFQARIIYDESRDRSNRAQTRAQEKIDSYREKFLAGEAVSLGLPARQFDNFGIESLNVSTSRQMGQFLLGLMLPIMLIAMLGVGGLYPAVDSTAGERENSTWETAMTFGTARLNIVAAKYLYVATMSLTAATLNLTAMIVSMRSLIAPLKGTNNLSFQVPLRSLPILLLGALLMALFVAAGMMILASFARTFKEGQSLVSPFYIAIVIPVVFLQTPGLVFTPKLALIPVVNVAMMFRSAILGNYPWTLFGITVAVEIVCVALALKIAATILSHEDVLTGSYKGSFGKFFKERLVRK